jgi:hypothetical protein
MADDLTVEEIVDRLRIGSPKIVSDLYALANRQLDVEDKRETNLNGKAVSLLSASGFSVTVLFALAGVLAQHPELLEQLGPVGTWQRDLLAYSYGLAIVFGIAAGILGVSALKVASYVTVAESDVFGNELRASDDKRDPSRYRRYLTAHLWRIYRKNFKKHEKKARKVLFGQYSFSAFLVLLIPIAFSMVSLLRTVTPPVSVQIMSAKSPDEQKPSQPASPPAAPNQKPPPTAIPSSGEQFQNDVPPGKLPSNAPSPAKPKK